MHLLTEPLAWLLVAAVTLIGTASNVVLYKLGEGGTEVVLQRIPRINPERLYRAQDLVEERGSWILLLSGVPGLGMVLVTAAGILQVRLSEFLLWVLISLGVRNWLVPIAWWRVTSWSQDESANKHVRATPGITTAKDHTGLDNWGTVSVSHCPRVYPRRRGEALPASACHAEIVRCRQTHGAPNGLAGMPRPYTDYAASLSPSKPRVDSRPGGRVY